MYGPTQPFICNEWGHKCLVPPGLPNVGMTLTPSRYAPNSLATDTVTYTAAAATTSNCESFEDSPVLTAVGVSADEIKGLKADPYNQIAVAAVVGLNEGPDSNGYTVAWRAPPVADTGPWPFIEHACGAEGSATGYADPAVRIEQFAEQFGASGSVDSFCAASYGPSVAASLASAAGPPCIKGKIATLPNSNSPDCAVTELVPNPADPAHPTATDVPACAGLAPPCWSLAAPPPGSSAACTAVIALDLGTIQPPADAVANVNCNLCIPGVPEPSVGCP